MVRPVSRSGAEANPARQRRGWLGLVTVGFVEGSSNEFLFPSNGFAGRASMRVRALNAPAPAPIRAAPRDRDAPDVFLNGKPLGARAPSNSRTRRGGPTPAPGSVPPCGQKTGLRVRFKDGSGVEGYARTKRPKSAREQRPVRQRHRSVASCRARATTVFLRKAVPVVMRAMSLVRACQSG